MGQIPDWANFLLSNKKLDKDTSNFFIEQQIKDTKDYFLKALYPQLNTEASKYGDFIGFLDGDNTESNIDLTQHNHGFIITLKDIYYKKYNNKGLAKKVGTHFALNLFKKNEDETTFVSLDSSVFTHNKQVVNGLTIDQNPTRCIIDKITDNRPKKIIKLNSHRQNSPLGCLEESLTLALELASKPHVFNRIFDSIDKFFSNNLEGKYRSLFTKKPVSIIHRRQNIECQALSIADTISLLTQDNEINNLFSRRTEKNTTLSNNGITPKDNYIRKASDLLSNVIEIYSMSKLQKNLQKQMRDGLAL